MTHTPLNQTTCSTHPLPELNRLNASELIHLLECMNGAFDPLSWQRCEQREVIGLVSDWQATAKWTEDGLVNLLTRGESQPACFQSAQLAFEQACSNLANFEQSISSAQTRSLRQVFVQLSFDATAQRMDYGKHQDRLPAFELISYPVCLIKDQGMWKITISTPTSFDLLAFKQLIQEAALSKSKSSSAYVSLGDTSAQPNSACPANTGVGKSATGQLTPTWEADSYSKAYARVQDYLRAGDCYQVNLAQHFSATVQPNYHQITAALDLATQAPFAGGLIWQSGALISCSPELFLSFKQDQGQIKVTTKPIKGTAARGKSTQQDEALKYSLQNSEKDKAENLMIVDLLRHDLGRLCQTGSVKVEQLFELQSFAQVHHLVSSVTGTLLPQITPLQALFDASPGGSITGAPKHRSVQIIDELEACARGNYCGSLGFLDAQGNGVFNLMIRTAQISGAQLDLWAGGGVTVASDCAREYQECFDKISGMMRALGEFIED